MRRGRSPRSHHRHQVRCPHCAHHGGGGAGHPVVSDAHLLHCHPSAPRWRPQQCHVSQHGGMALEAGRVGRLAMEEVAAAAGPVHRHLLDHTVVVAVQLPAHSPSSAPANAMPRFGQLARWAHHIHHILNDHQGCTAHSSCTANGCLERGPHGSLRPSNAPRHPPQLLRRRQTSSNSSR